MKVLIDKSEAEIKKEFDNLQKEAGKFHASSEEGQVLEIIVRWIGWDVDVSKNPLLTDKTANASEVYQPECYGLTI